jgi:hypothetical protein
MMEGTRREPRIEDDGGARAYLWRAHPTGDGSGERMQRAAEATLVVERHCVAYRREAITAHW